MSQKLNCVEISGSDDRMDERVYRGTSMWPLNPLPPKCPICSFPDLDHVPQPYLLGKGTTKPGDMALAKVGNFFVRERARKVIEAVCPGQCAFYPTFARKTGEPTAWSLAVPLATVSIGTVKPEIPRRVECHEPKAAHGTQYHRSPPESMESDIAKSSTWISEHSQQWSRGAIGRWIFFSVRLEKLLIKLGIKGVYRWPSSKQTPTKSDLARVDEQVEKLTALGLATPPPAGDPAKLRRWFRSYLKKHATEQRPAPDFAALEARLGKPLPDSFKAFLSKVGPTTFPDLDEEEGADVRIYGLEDLEDDCHGLRLGRTEFEDEESAAVDGLEFAGTIFGDAFCFDLAAAGPDYPVYHYQHEINLFEPYAANFEECLKRFANA